MSEFKLKPGFVSPDKIFIWVGYGDVSVYLIDTEEKYHALQDTIYNVCKDLSDNPDAFPKESIKKMIDNIGGVGCHETFEHGTGFTILK